MYFVQLRIAPQNPKTPFNLLIFNFGWTRTGKIIF